MRVSIQLSLSKNEFVSSAEKKPMRALLFSRGQPAARTERISRSRAKKIYHRTFLARQIQGAHVRRMSFLVDSWRARLRIEGEG